MQPYKEPQISVMMPCCNNGAFIKPAIESVLKQRIDASFELVIVDDASTDNSVTTIKSIDDRRIRLLRNKVNRGIGVVRNQLLQTARGPWLTSLDGDDFYTTEDKLAREWELVLRANDPETTVVYSDFELVDVDGALIARASRLAPPQEGRIFQAMLDRRVMIPRDFLAPARLCQSVGGFDETLPLYEDWDFKLRLAQRADFFYTGSVGIGYRRHSGGLSAAIWPVHRKQMARVRSKYGVLGFNGDPLRLLDTSGAVSTKMFRNRAA